MSDIKVPKGAKTELAPLTTDQVHLDVSVIHIPEDRLRLRLGESTAIRESRNAWQAPLGVFLALLLALSTATFKDFLLEASTWKAVFVIGDVASAVWLVRTLVRRPKIETVDQLVERIKEQHSTEESVS